MHDGATIQIISLRFKKEYSRGLTFVTNLIFWPFLRCSEVKIHNAEALHDRNTETHSPMFTALGCSPVSYLFLVRRFLRLRQVSEWVIPRLGGVVALEKSRRSVGGRGCNVLAKFCCSWSSRIAGNSYCQIWLEDLLFGGCVEQIILYRAFKLVPTPKYFSNENLSVTLYKAYTRHCLNLEKSVDMMESWRRIRKQHRAKFFKFTMRKYVGVLYRKSFWIRNNIPFFWYSLLFFLNCPLPMNKTLQSNFPTGSIKLTVFEIKAVWYSIDIIEALPSQYTHLPIVDTFLVLWPNLISYCALYFGLNLSCNWTTI